VSSPPRAPFPSFAFVDRFGSCNPIRL
jgi:hypothetical protein